jgi:hypothetical protein
MMDRGICEVDIERWKKAVNGAGSLSISELMFATRSLIRVYEMLLDGICTLSGKLESTEAALMAAEHKIDLLKREIAALMDSAERGAIALNEAGYSRQHGEI